MVEAQWDILLAATLGKSAILSVQPREGAPRPMAVRAEKAIGAAGGYIVVIEALLEPGSAAPTFPDDQAEALQLFAEKGDVGFFDLNLKARRVVYSPAWKRMLGYSDAELADTYEAWLGLLHPEDSAAAPDKAGRRFKVGARPFGVEFRMKHKLGHWAWIHCVGLQMVSTCGRAGAGHRDPHRRDRAQGAGGGARWRATAACARSAEEGVSGRLRARFHRRDLVVLRRLAAAPRRVDRARRRRRPPSARRFRPTNARDGIEAWLLAQAPGQTSFSRVLEPAQQGRADAFPRSSASTAR